MRPGFDQSPVNPLPPVVWVLILPIAATEILFALGGVGFVGGQSGIGLRSNAINWAFFSPEFLVRMWQTGDLNPDYLRRLVTYPFVHLSALNALFVGVFTLALGKMVAEYFKPAAVLVLFFGSAIGAALIYTLFALLVPVRISPLVGGYPAVYGFVGAFTFILWTRLGMENANRMRAFTLIGMLLLFQLVFGVVFGNSDYVWVAEIAGFCVGFALCFVLVPGGIARVLRELRRR
ncbi:rhomboid family intramembrane serine protease [Paracoccus pacificus]|uniref:Rhomboid family intramembrane serine protease n=1 Tax=Paracoccus pacificus TaxID=1463598 RepID=A0ABW4R3R7_9RHOB